jgi:hypothetical protein
VYVPELSMHTAGDPRDPKWTNQKQRLAPTRIASSLYIPREPFLNGVRVKSYSQDLFAK